jgi:cytochrome P450
MSALRDEAVYDHPDVFDISREISFACVEVGICRNEWSRC